MAKRKVTLHVPEPLWLAMIELPDEVNLSAMFQDALRDRLRGATGCTHELVSCVVCSRSGTPAELMEATQRATQPPTATQRGT